VLIFERDHRRYRLKNSLAGNINPAKGPGAFKAPGNYLKRAWIRESSKINTEEREADGRGPGLHQSFEIRVCPRRLGSHPGLIGREELPRY